jgi:hypothetical protein
MDGAEFSKGNNVMRLFWLAGSAAAAILAGTAAAQPAAQRAARTDSPARLPQASVATDEQVTESSPAAASAPAAARPVAPPTAEERQRLFAAATRGRLLFDLAAAGQITTRDMLSRVADPAAAGISGWVAAPEGEGLSVVYYADTPAGPVAVYRAQVVGGRIASQEVFTGAGRPALSPILRRMAAARAAVADLDRQPCGGDFNVIVVPPASDTAPVEVYKLSPQMQRGHYPLGGHFLATVAPDGTVASTRAFTNACVDLEATAPAGGVEPRPLVVTHLLDPLPTEIHVFLSLWMNRPLVVGTGAPERQWTVSRGRIGLIGLAQTAPVPPPGAGR